MQWEFAPYILALLVTAAIAATISVHAWRHRRLPGATPFAVCSLAISGWSLIYPLELMAPDLPTKLLWANFQYLAIVTLPLGWFLMTLEYTGRSGWLSRRALIWLSIVPSITLVLVWTNDLHELMRRGVFLDTAGAFPVVGKTFGPWFWIHTAYSYSLLSISMLLLAEAVKRAPTFYRGQPLTLLVGLLIPLVSNVAYVLGFRLIPGVDTTPITMGLSGMVLAWGIFRHRLFDVVPIAHDLVIEGMSDGVVVLDRHGCILELNRAAESILGCPSSRAVGLRSAQLLSRWPRLIELTHTPSPARAEVALDDGDTEARQHYEVYVSPLADPRGRIIGHVAVLHDITQRTQAEKALQEANEHLARWVGELEQRNREAGFLNEMGELLQACPSAEAAYSIAAGSAQKLFPGAFGAVLVLSPSTGSLEAVATWGEIHCNGKALASSECGAIRGGQVAAAGDARAVVFCPHLNQNLPSGCLCLPMVAQGEILGVLHLRFAVEDSPQADGSPGEVAESRRRLAITVADHVALALANLRLRQTLRDQAIRDPLTGLFNRRYLEEALEREVRRAARRKNSLGVIMLDMDNFKAVNDLFGHEAGDSLLSALGGYLRSHVRVEDIACRYGGDELLLLMPEAPIDICRRRAEELRQGIKLLTVDHRGQRLGPTTASIGIATFPEHGESTEALLRAADAALYLAKASGRDRVEMAGGIAP